MKKYKCPCCADMIDEDKFDHEEGACHYCLENGKHCKYCSELFVNDCFSDICSDCIGDNWMMNGHEDDEEVK